MSEKIKNILLKVLIGIVAVMAIAIIILIVTRPKPDAVPADLQSIVDQMEQTALTSDRAEPIMLTTVELSQMTEQVGELTTQKYYYKDVHEEKKEKEGFFDSEELTLIVYEGTIHAGVNLQNIHYDVDNEAKKIMIMLPETEILSHEFDNNSVKSYTVKKGIFSKEPSYEGSAQKFEELKNIKEEALMQDEAFWESVMEDTKTTLTNFFSLADATKDYTIEYVESMPEIPETEPESDSESEMENVEAPDAE